MSTHLPCPHADCSHKDVLFKDLQSHYTAMHKGSIYVNDGQKAQKERQKQAMIHKVLNMSSKSPFDNLQKFPTLGTLVS